MKSSNNLYYGDNLEIMKLLLEERRKFIDLVYIDPPFNSKRNYNIFYKDRVNRDDITQIEVFKDTWSNIGYQNNIEEIKELGLSEINEYLTFIKNTMPLNYISYLSMMAIRIYYIRELLKDTGSFYLHCDPTMSHYLKIICDLIFGINNFRNEITWCYKKLPNNAKIFQRNKDIILFYTKSNDYTFNKQYTEPTEESLNTFKTAKNIGYNANHSKKMVTVFNWDKYNEAVKKGKIPADLKPKKFTGGKALMRDYWADIKIIGGSKNKERLGYPTQKPLALLERIIKASSKKSDIVADFFCGCGTTVDAAINLKRKFIGVDISTLSINLIEKRIKDRHNFIKDRDYTTKGLPTNLEQAEKLAEQDKYEFQDWVISYLVGGVPNQKKTGDKGVDGFFYFKLPNTNESKLCIVEVKGGKNLSIPQVRSFIKTCKDKKDTAGLFLTMGNITDGMKKECYEVGNISAGIPKINIVSIKDIMDGKEIKILNYNITHSKAVREKAINLL